MEMNGASKYPSPLSSKNPFMDAHMKVPQFIAMRKETKKCIVIDFFVSFFICLRLLGMKSSAPRMIVDNTILYATSVTVGSSLNSFQ